MNNEQSPKKRRGRPKGSKNNCLPDTTKKVFTRSDAPSIAPKPQLAQSNPHQLPMSADALHEKLLEKAGITDEVVSSAVERVAKVIDKGGDSDALRASDMVFRAKGLYKPQKKIVDDEQKPASVTINIAVPAWLQKLQAQSPQQLDEAIDIKGEHI